MKAAVFSAPNTIQYVQDYPEPSLTNGLLLRVRASGICGTDIKALSGTRPGMQPPMILGHELAGEVLHSTLAEFPAGERVSVAPYAGCGTCRFCLSGREDQCRNKVMLSGGAFAEKVVVPALLAEKTAWKIPADVKFEEAALAEPLACVAFSLKTCRWEPGWNILVVGGGFMGLLHVLLASAWGAARVLVTEPNPTRRALAQQLGALTHDPAADGDLAKWAAAQTEGLGPQVVITAVAVPEVVESAISAARPGGVVHLFGGLPKDRRISVSSYDIHYRSISLVGTSGFRTPDYRLAADMIAHRKLDLTPLISANLPLQEAEAGFLQAKSGQAVKVVITQE
ncbi:MAG: L-iditol 2-dehydrogenase [Chloroflexota bacterium]|nr:L-iditol 2-dehydrogenase [Chloroflexota bacterium]